MLGKNFKKLLALLLALVMVFSLCACQGPADGGDGEGEGEGAGQQGGPQAPGLNIDPEKMTDKELMLAVEQQSIQGAVGVLMEVLKAVETTDMSNINTNLGAQLGVTIRPSAQLIQLFQTSYVPTEVIDLTGLEKLGLDMTTNMSGDMIQILAGLSVNGKKLADVDMITDMATMTIWLGLPGLVDEYLQLDAETLGSMGQVEEAPMTPAGDANWSSSEQADVAMAPAAIIELLPKVMPDPEKLEPLLNKYIGIMLGAIEDVKRENVALELDGVKQNALKLTYTITEENLAKMILAVMKAAKDDADLKVVVDELSADLQTVATEMGGRFDQDLWTMLKAFCESGIAYFESLTEFNAGNYVVITTTLDSGNHVIGRSFKMATDNDDDIALEYLTVTEGNTRAMQVVWNAYSQQYSHYDYDKDEPVFINVKQEIALTGTSTLSNGAVTGGTYELCIAQGDEEYKLLTVKLEDMSDTTGTVTITPAADLYRMIFGSAVEMSASLVLSVKDEMLTIEVIVEGQMLIGIDLTAKETTPAAVQKPTNIFDMENGNMSSWLGEDALIKLIENWNATGMPQITLPEE